MTTIWNELRLIFAYWLLSFLLRVTPAQHPDGRKLLTLLVTTVRINVSGQVAP